MTINVSKLTKMQLRKLNALRKSIGKDIADSAFVQWMAKQPQPVEDDTKEQVRKLLEKPVLSGKLKIDRTGLIIRRGRGRLLVEDNLKRAKSTRRTTAKRVAKKRATRPAPASAG